MSRRLPKYLLEKHQLTGTLTFAVLFAMIFLNLYIPFSDTAWFRLGNSVFFLFTTGFISISILFLIISRVLMYKTRRLFDMTWLQYVLWCVCEVLVICLFYTFVTVDVVRPSELPPLRVFLKSLLYTSMALLIPYSMSAMYFMISEKERTIRLMNCAVAAREAAQETPDQDGAVAAKPAADSLISLFDNSGNLKLSVRSSDLYYIESDDNYIKVWYDGMDGALKTYMLRCRLKTVEESFRGTSLVRCNRKYIVNADRVKTLRKEPEGYFLYLDKNVIPPISVTRTYSDAVVERFSGVRQVREESQPENAVRTEDREAEGRQ